MARPAQLTATISSAFQVLKPTITEQTRLLRNARLVTKDKPGPGKGTMTPRDAATLLLAVAGTARPKDTCRIVETQGAYRLWPYTNDAIALDELGAPRLQSLDADHTFIDGIEALIQEAIDDPQSLKTRPNLGVLMKDTNLARPSDTAHTLVPSIVIEEPYGRCRIDFAVLSKGRNNEYRDRDIVARRTYDYRKEKGGPLFPFGAAGPAHLRHEHIVYHDAIIALAELFHH